MVDVLLLNPPSIFTGPPEEHLGLAYLAAALRENGMSVEIIDAPTEKLDYADLAAELSRRHFRILGVSNLFQSNLTTILKWLETLKAGGLAAHITIGGHPATFTYNEILTQFNAVDSVVRGEGEHTIVYLAKALLTGEDWRSVDGIAWCDGEKIVVNPSRPLIADLNALPWPARDAYASRPKAFQQLTFSYSRGCKAFCAFCSIASFYRSFKGPVWRGRDPEDLLDEIEAAQRIAHNEMVLLIDDTFIGPGEIGRARAFELAEAFSARNLDYVWGAACRADQVEEELFSRLHDAGLRIVFLGIESGNDQTLRVFDKDTTVETNKQAIAILRKLGIVPELGFIMFNPYTTFANVRDDMDFLLDVGCGPDPKQIGEMNLFPGQRILTKLKADGLLRGTPLNYSADYVDKRVQALFGALQQIFSDESYPADEVMRITQSARFMPYGPRRSDLESITKTVAGLRKVTFDIINKATDLFELGEGPENIPLLTTELCERTNALLSKLKCDAQPVLADRIGKMRVVKNNKWAS